MIWGRRLATLLQLSEPSWPPPLIWRGVRRLPSPRENATAAADLLLLPLRENAGNTSYRLPSHRFSHTVHSPHQSPSPLPLTAQSDARTAPIPEELWLLADVWLLSRFFCWL